MDAEKNPVTQNKSGRIVFFDYTRALAIMMVVFIHIGFGRLNEIVLFALPLFFVTSGYLYSGRKSWRETVVSNFKKLMIPFYSGIIVYLLVELFRSAAFHYLSPRQMVKPILYNGLYGSGILPGFTEGLRALGRELCHKTQATPSVDVLMPTTCHLWFLPAMFSGSAIFAALAPRVKRPAARLCVIALLIGIASLEVTFPVIKQLPLSLGRGALAAAWMFAGLWLKELRFFQEKKGVRDTAVFAVSLLLMLASLYLGSNGSAMVVSYYGPYGAASVFVTYIGGLAAVIFVLYVFRWFDGLPLAGVKRVLTVTGKNTMTIYLWHMLPKTALELIYAKIIGRVPMLDEFYMGMMPEEAGLYMALEGVVIFALFYAVAAARKKRG